MKAQPARVVQTWFNSDQIRADLSEAERGPFFVLRHDPPSEPPVVKGVTGRFLDVGIAEAVKVVKGAAEGGDVVVLGANVARQCLEAGLLDEIVVHVAPVLLGDGVRLFERAGRVAVKLEPISSVNEGQTTVLRYSIGQAGAAAAEERA